MGLYKHSNKIIKLISRTYNINERLLIVQKYCDRFNNSSNGYNLEFRKGTLYYKRYESIHWSNSGVIDIDISEHFDIGKIRDQKLNDILYKE